jgi:hypothetical protein
MILWATKSFENQVYVMHLFSSKSHAHEYIYADCVHVLESMNSC